MPDQGIDVDRIAEQAERLGLVSPDVQGTDDEGGSDQIVVVIHIAGGLLAGVGTRRTDVPRLRVVVIDDDNYEAGDDAYTENVAALEDWPAGANDALARCRGELPGELIAALSIPDPTPRPSE
jgi:enamine deaminase RidA (YjgF/YER057c/UK114 family)